MWNEKDHPRDKDGRFTNGTSSARLGSIIPGRGVPYKSELPETIKLPDEQLPRSVGAKWRNEKIAMPDGTTAAFVEGSKLQDKEVFAGYGTNKPLRAKYALSVAYPSSTPEKWQKLKAKAQIVLKNGEIMNAEVHWYEEPTVGKVEFKYKKSIR